MEDEWGNWLIGFNEAQDPWQQQGTVMDAIKMFLPHHSANARWATNTLNSETINGNGQNFPVLSSGATVDDTGAVNISLANVDLVNTRAIDITLNSGTTSYFLSSAQIITAAAKDSCNDFGQDERVNIQPLAASNVQSCGRSVSVALPSKSVVMLRLLPAL